MIIKYSLPLKPSQRFETDSNNIIFGRNPSFEQHVDIDLVDDTYVSHVHARLSCENNQYWIEDLGTANGTWVNGIQIAKKTRLKPDDKIQVGWTIIEVVMDQAHHVSPQEPSIDPAIEAMLKPFPEPVGDTGKSVPPDPAILIEESVEQDFDSPTIIADTPEPEETNSPTIITEPKIVSPEPEENIGGTIVDWTDVTSPSYEMPVKGSAEKLLKLTLKQLAAFNNLCHMLGTAKTLDSLVQILVEHLRETIPNAQRGAVLLPDGQEDRLLLKAHWPQGDHSVSMTWITRAYHKKEPFIWSAPDENQCKSDTPHSAIYYSVKAAIYVPLVIGDQVFGVIYVDNYYICDAFTVTDLEFMRAISVQVAMFIRDQVLGKDSNVEEELRSTLSRQFPPRIAKRIFEKKNRLRAGGERVNPVTILVSDVRSFTALSANMHPDDVVRMLNEMFDAFVPIIFENDGIVDKYVGDAVLAVFGSPEKDEHQCEKAVRAALEMQKAVHKLSEGRKVRRLPVFTVGISVHTGEVIHGFIGSSEKLEYTVIGDTVNSASRHCDGADPGEVIISKSVYERIYHLVKVHPKIIRTKHPDTEPDLHAYIVTGLKDES